MMWGWEWGWMALWMSVFWVSVVLLVIWGVRHMSPPGRSGGSRAMEILEERFARGEIDQDEFESRRRDLIR
jgi:putative membrane protein